MPINYHTELDKCIELGVEWICDKIWPLVETDENAIKSVQKVRKIINHYYNTANATKELDRKLREMKADMAKVERRAG